MERKEMLKKIQSYNFAAYDLLLYLDTHPDDKKAFALFKDAVKKTRLLITEYENGFGPLCAFSAADSKNFDWLENPWPWEKEGNK